MPSQNPAENDEEDEDHVHFMSSSGSSTAGGSGKGTAKTATNPETYYELIGEEKSHLARTHTHTNVPTNAQQITKTY